VHVVGQEHVQAWTQMEELRLYTAPNSLPFGLVGTVRRDDVVHIASAVRDPAVPFTRGMLRDIIHLIRTERVVIVTDHPDYHDHIRRALIRYNMRYEVRNDILYSRNYHV